MPAPAQASSSPAAGAMPCYRRVFDLCGRAPSNVCIESFAHIPEHDELLPHQVNEQDKIFVVTGNEASAVGRSVSPTPSAGSNSSAAAASRKQRSGSFVGKLKRAFRSSSSLRRRSAGDVLSSSSSSSSCCAQNSATNDNVVLMDSPPSSPSLSRRGSPLASPAASPATARRHSSALLLSS